MQTFSTAQTFKAFINGKIYTVNEKQPLAEAVLIENDKIILVGTTEEVLTRTGIIPEVIDLGGKLMLPGFIDNHTHFLSGGFYISGIDLRPAKSKQQFKEILRSYIELHPDRWITGGRWDHETWDEKILPTKELIDDISESTPVFVSRLDGHMGLANSYALKQAGITKETKDPIGGLIERDPVTGEPTGILKDNAMDLIFSIIPEHSEKEKQEALTAALNEAKRLGVTTVQDITEFNDLSTLVNAHDNGLLTCRMYCRLPITNYRDLIKLKTSIKQDNIFSLGSLKAYSDGSLGSSTAWLFDEYENSDNNFGLANDIVLDGRLEKWATDADINHLQVCVHAIGDKANSFLLDMYEKIKNENPYWDRRFRIEHAQHLRTEDLGRFQNIGVLASMQPVHLLDDGNWAHKRLGDRITSSYKIKSLLDDSACVSFGTDWPVAPLNPLLGIYAAVTRSTSDNLNPEGWIPEEKISVEEAIRCYTINSAYAGFQEKYIGSIEEGKLADLIILDEDIFSIPPQKIKDVSVVMTIFNGKIIYKK